MKRGMWLSTVATLAVVGFWVARKILDKRTAPSKVSIVEAKGSGYWTCPMHPQVHLDHAGECPICHMRLVQVKAPEVQVSESRRAAVQASTEQFELIGVQKQQVERMDLSLSIPVAGRLLSGSSVAFQVYESDLAFIKGGLSFKGQSSFVPGGEIAGVIVAVDSIVDPTSRTVRVVGRIDKGPHGLIAETTFSGVVTVPLKNRISIPESAVLHTGSGDLVYVFAAGNKLAPREVRLGPKTEGFYEVVSGLEAGEFISSGPNFLIDSEAKIRGTADPAPTEGKPRIPECPENQHWDLGMAMCMPGQAAP